MDADKSLEQKCHRDESRLIKQTWGAVFCYTSEDIRLDRTQASMRSAYIYVSAVGRRRCGTGSRCKLDTQCHPTTGETNKDFLVVGWVKRPLIVVKSILITLL